MEQTKGKGGRKTRFQHPWTPEEEESLREETAAAMSPARVLYVTPSLASPICVGRGLRDFGFQETFLSKNVPVVGRICVGRIATVVGRIISSNAPHVPVGSTGTDLRLIVRANERGRFAADAFGPHPGINISKMFTGRAFSFAQVRFPRWECTRYNYIETDEAFAKCDVEFTAIQETGDEAGWVVELISPQDALA